jgi:hypothetical protein
MSGKPCKPDNFDGTKTTPSAIRSWLAQTKDYLELTDTTEDKRGRTAATYLKELAREWYDTTFVDAPPATWKVFEDAFKDHYMKISDAMISEILDKIENSKQNGRTVQDYTGEFKILLLAAGDEVSTGMARKHFVAGLDMKIKRNLVPVLHNFPTAGKTPIAITDEVSKAAQNIQDNLGSIYDDREKTTKTVPTSSNSTLKTSAQSRPGNSSSSSSSFSTNLSDEERSMLMKFGGCFYCKKIRAGHRSWECPERKKGGIRPPKEVIIKKETVNSMSVEEENEDPVEAYSSFRPIVVKAKVKQHETTALVDPGAAINIMDPTIANGQLIESIRPVRLSSQALTNIKPITIDSKAVTEINLPEIPLQSQPRDFLVAPLKDNGVILGMPFLAQEKLLVDPAHRQIIRRPGDTIDTILTNSEKVQNLEAGAPNLDSAAAASSQKLELSYAPRPGKTSSAPASSFKREYWDIISDYNSLEGRDPVPDPIKPDPRDLLECNEVGARRKAGMNYKLYSCSCTREYLHKQILNILP